jgi:hypothetical protein
MRLTGPLQSVASRRSTQKRASQCSAARSNRSGRLTGESYGPVLVLDHGEVIEDSDNIVAWHGTTRPAARLEVEARRFAQVGNRS